MKNNLCLIVGILFSFLVYCNACTCGQYVCGATDACCEDQSIGSVCYNPLTYSCVNDNLLCASGFLACGDYPSQRCYDPTVHVCFSDGFLCPVGTKQCGPACYQSSQYYCVDNQLQQSGVCVPTASQEGFFTNPSTAIGYTNADTDNPILTNPTVDGNGSLILTPCEEHAAGSWMYPYQVCSSDQIYVRFQWSVDAGCNSSTIADGIAFVMQTQGNIAIGESGDDLGAAEGSPYGTISNAFVVGYSIYHHEIRVFNTDANGDINNETVASVNSSALPSITEIIWQGNSTYAVINNGDVLIYFDASEYNFISSSTSTAVWVGITAADGIFASSFTLQEFYYSNNAQ